MLVIWLVDGGDLVRVGNLAPMGTLDSLGLWTDGIWSAGIVVWWIWLRVGLEF